MSADDEAYPMEEGRDGQHCRLVASVVSVVLKEDCERAYRIWVDKRRTIRLEFGSTGH